MQQGFVFFLGACNHQRHLLIAVECLQRQIEEGRSVLNKGSENFAAELVEKIVELSGKMIDDMEQFAGILSRNKGCIKSALNFLEIEKASHQLLDANLSVIETVLLLTKAWNFSPKHNTAMQSISSRTRCIRAQLCEYAGFNHSELETKEVASSL